MKLFSPRSDKALNPGGITKTFIVEKIEPSVNRLVRVTETASNYNEANKNAALCLKALLNQIESITHPKETLENDTLNKESSSFRFR